MLRVDRAIRGNTFARSAVETALLDAQGKRLGLPVSEVLGGRVRDGVEVAWTLASGETAKDIEEAERMLDLRRHRHFKLKIGAGSRLAILLTLRQSSVPLVIEPVCAWTLTRHGAKLWPCVLVVNWLMPVLS